MKTTKITVVSSNGVSVLTVGTFPVTVSVFKTWIKAGNFNATVRVVNDHLFVYCKDRKRHYGWQSAKSCQLLSRHSISRGFPLGRNT